MSQLLFVTPSPRPYSIPPLIQSFYFPAVAPGVAQVAWHIDHATHRYLGANNLPNSKTWFREHTGP